MRGSGAAWLAAAAILVLVGYLELIEWVDLAPWNNVASGNGQAGLDVAIGILGLGLAIAVSRGSLVALWAALGGLVCWLYLQISTWWVPYFTGASPGWRRAYARWFAGTVQIWPGDARHLPPDAAHTLLHALLLGASFAVLATLATRRPRDHAMDQEDLP